MSSDDKPTDAIPEEIFVLTGRSVGELAPRRGGEGLFAQHLTAVKITALQGQVNVFLQQFDQVLRDTPEKVGGFRLEEIEVSAGLVLNAKSGIQLVLLANAEVGGEVSAELKFVFKRS